MELKIKEHVSTFVKETIGGETKKAGQTLLKAGQNSIQKLSNKYDALCEKGGKRCASVLSNLSGRKLSPQLTEKVAKNVLKVLPIALLFLAMAPMLSITSLVLAGAVSTAAVLLDPKVLPVAGKVKILEGAALGIALQTTLTILRSLVTLSPFTAVGALVVGGAATGLALYASRALKA
ncbi:MAG: hypothetical protein LLG04_07495 [Parachlamydia sp.]|nr:hypothetical protein [Parachlamydia sp.]